MPCGPIFPIHARHRTYQQCLQHQVGGLPAPHRPAHHAARVKVDHDSQIDKAFQGADVGDVRHPCLVWGCNIELPGQCVVDHLGWLAAVTARPALVADPRLDPGQAGKASHPVRAAGLTLVEQVVVQLAIAVNLAALFPGLPDQSGLPSIFLRPLAQRVL